MTTTDDSIGQLAADTAEALDISYEEALDRIRTALAQPRPVQAVVEDARPPWKLTWGDDCWTEADLTGEHAALLAVIHDDSSWAPLDMSPFDGPVALMAYLTAFVVVADGRDALEVQIEIAQRPLSELMGALGVLPASAEQQSEGQ